MARTTEALPGAGEEALGEGASQSPLKIALRRLLKKRIAMIAIVYILIFYAAGATAPLLDGAGAIPGYTEQDLEEALEGPSMSHPFGTDRLGRDQLSRVIWAAQTTVIITVVVMVSGGLVLTVSMGLLSGYVGGWVDSLIMRVGDVFISLPGLLMLILINASLGDQVESLARDIENGVAIAPLGISLFTIQIGGLVRSGAPDYFLIAAALTLFSWVGGARVIRSQILALRETEFILAARALGASTPRILFRHLLPNVSNIIIVSLSLSLAGIAGSEIVLSWFGVGVQPPHPSFGALIFDASSVRTVNEHAYLLAFPGLIVAALFFAFNLLGDALTDVFTPRAR